MDSAVLSVSQWFQINNSIKQFNGCQILSACSRHVQLVGDSVRFCMVYYTAFSLQFLVNHYLTKQYQNNESTKGA